MATAIIKQSSPKRFSMGLEKDNMHMFPQTESSYEMPFIKGKWQHGLDDDEKMLVEEYYGHQFDNADHYNFWANLGPFKLSHRVSGVSTKDPKTILMLGVLKYMKELAPNLNESLDPMKDYPFVVSNVQEETENKATIFEKYHDAIAKLKKLKSSKKHLISVAKFILPRNISVVDETSAYVKLAEFIDCDIKTKHNPTKSDAIFFFNKVTDLDKAELYATVDFKDAYSKNIIRRDGDMYYYNTFNNTRLGKNEEECVQFLLNPKNQDELGLGNSTDKPYSIRYQLSKF